MRRWYLQFLGGGFGILTILLAGILLDRLSVHMLGVRVIAIIAFVLIAIGTVLMALYQLYQKK
jgi:MFS family permease